MEFGLSAGESEPRARPLARSQDSDELAEEMDGRPIDCLTWRLSDAGDRDRDRDCSGPSHRDWHESRRWRSP